MNLLWTPRNLASLGALRAQIPTLSITTANMLAMMVSILNKRDCVSFTRRVQLWDRLGTDPPRARIEVIYVDLQPLLEVKVTHF